MPCAAGTKIPSKEFVRTVYTDAIGYVDGWAAKNNIMNATPYMFIDTVSRRTGDRLRLLGAHADSSRFSKTTYLIAFHLLWTDEVDCDWLTEWEEAIKGYSQSLGSFKSLATVVFEATVPKVKDLLGLPKVPDFTVPLVLFGAFLLTRGRS